VAFGGWSPKLLACLLPAAPADTHTRHNTKCVCCSI
jgi:hypothetical protein